MAFAILVKLNVLADKMKDANPVFYALRYWPVNVRIQVKARGRGDIPRFWCVLKNLVNESLGDTLRTSKYSYLVTNGWGKVSAIKIYEVVALASHFMDAKRQACLNAAQPSMKICLKIFFCAYLSFAMPPV